MKQVVITIICIFALVSLVSAEFVSGYFKKDGSYVNGYFRSDRNSTVSDNYSFKNNYNPYTSERGSNYYRDNSSSYYYKTTPKRTKSIWDEE